jgi:uncharacterized protein YjcR
MTPLIAQELNSRATIHDAREEIIKEYLSRTSDATEEILREVVHRELQLSEHEHHLTAGLIDRMLQKENSQLKVMGRCLVWAPPRAGVQGHRNA